MKLIGKIPIEIVFLLLLVWQILLTFQGLDLADTGFDMTAFRFIFDDPYSVQYSMMFWLSDVCGSLWMRLLPSGGLYWFRIGWVIVISITFLFYYALLLPGLGKKKAIVGLAITLLFILQGGPECLNYDIFSTLGYGLGIFSIYQGLQKNSFRLIFLSGLLFGISVFFKLSNLSALAFYLLIPFSCFLSKESFREFFSKSLFWLFGFAGGMIFILFLIWHAGHFDLFLNNLSVVSSMGKDVHSSHGVIPMLFSYITGYLNAFICLIIFIAIVWGYLKLANKYPQLFLDKSQIFLLFFVGGSVVLLSVLFEVVFWSKVRYLFIALMIVQGSILIVNKISRNEIRLLSFAGLILLLIAPLGSDSGLEKSIWGMWILGPMVLTMPIDLKQLNLSRMPIPINQTRFLKRALALVILLSAMIYAWQNTYFDAGSRSQKTYSIQHPKMNCIYTSSERAKVVNELIHDAFPKIENEKYLLAFIEIPMINYLSDKKPFISTSWPKLYYNPQTFRLKLEEALQLRKIFPAIIRQKQNTMMAFWPGSPDPEYLNYPESLSKWPEHGKILNEFIIRNHYQVIWENEMFQLLMKKTGFENDK
jgi:hypothetical protein